MAKSVLKDDAIYDQFNDIIDLPENVVYRLRHYFLTYKDFTRKKTSECKITHVYNKNEGFKVIENSIEDYHHKFDFLNQALRFV
jgi:inorganic pyrophosphatase